MEISYKIIGRHIQAARKQHKFTQEYMAEKLKMSVAHYGRLERGERQINLERLAQISVLLGVTMAQLLEGCLPDSDSIIAENAGEKPFLNQMARYPRFCKEETLSRMLRVCDALASEDADQ